MVQAGKLNWDVFYAYTGYLLLMTLLTAMIRGRDVKRMILFLRDTYKDQPKVSKIARQAIFAIFPKFAVASPLIGALVMVVLSVLLKFLMADSQLQFSEIAPMKPIVWSTDFICQYFLTDPISWGHPFVMMN